MQKSVGQRGEWGAKEVQCESGARGRSPWGEEPSVGSETNSRATCFSPVAVSCGGRVTPAWVGQERIVGRPCSREGKRVRSSRGAGVVEFTVDTEGSESVRRTSRCEHRPRLCRQGCEQHPHRSGQAAGWQQSREGTEVPPSFFHVLLGPLCLLLKLLLPSVPRRESGSVSSRGQRDLPAACGSLSPAPSRPLLTQKMVASASPGSAAGIRRKACDTKFVVLSSLSR